jgi:hypothetical protein
VAPFTRLRFREILAVLLRHHVDFIVVGGIGAVLQGSPLSTFDLDVVHCRTPENVERLVRALAEMHATYRMRPELSPGESHLETKGHQLLSTDFGSLDVLGAIGHDSDFEALLPFCKLASVEGSGEVRVLELSKLIEVKEETAGDKDRAQLPILKQVLREIRAREKS